MEKKKSIISDTAPTQCGTRITAAHSAREIINIFLLSVTHITTGRDWQDQVPDQENEP